MYLEQFVVALNGLLPKLTLASKELLRLIRHTCSPLFFCKKRHPCQSCSLYGQARFLNFSQSWLNALFHTYCKHMWFCYQQCFCRIDANQTFKECNL